MAKTPKLSNSHTLPAHVAFIVDGNRRWAKKRHVPSVMGHKRAVDVVMDWLIFRFIELKIPYITFWVWSTENWKRGIKFANLLFNILRINLKNKAQKYIDAGVKLNIIGDLTKLPKDLQKLLEDVKQNSKNNKKLTATIAINYGGQDEIVRAIKKLYQSNNNPWPPAGRQQSTINNLTTQQFSKYLDTVDIPDPDLIIRTGGAQRLSGFLLWQSQYAELYFISTLFPDFDEAALQRALEDFVARKRNFGK